MSIIDAIKGTPCLSLRQEAGLLFAFHRATLVIKGLRDRIKLNFYLMIHG